jgi:predicted RNA-binding Zn-ribbon protein involved in translation (DUF1610 family)
MQASISPNTEYSVANPIPPCPKCGLEMRMVAVRYTASSQVVQYRCVICAWRTERSPTVSLQG